MHKLLLATTCLALGLAPLETQLCAADEPATLVTAEWQPLHDRWQAIVDEFQIPGLAVVAVKGDEIILLDVIGACDPAGQQMVTPRSPFYLASVTKSFTALGVAILVEEGKVQLDEPVKTYLPKFTLADKERARSITVRDLLCHRYGLNSEPISMGEAYLGNMTEDRYYRLLAAVQPLERFSYSNLHYTLAGRVIEAVSGKPWQDFLAERVFAPLAMDASTCYASQLYANPLAARPLAARDGGWQLARIVKTDSVMHAAGGMGASVADLANWLRFQLSGRTPDGRQLVSSELLREIQTEQTTNGRPASEAKVARTGYSLGWFTGSFFGHRMLEHGGGYVGTSTNVSFLPDDDIGVAVLVNQSAPAVPLLVVRDVYAKLLDVAASDLLPEVRTARAKRAERLAARVKYEWEPPTTAQGLSQPIGNYAGSYENPVWGTARVEADGEELCILIGDFKLRWHALGDDRFRLELPSADVTKGQFAIDADGHVIGFAVATPMGSAVFQKTD